MGVKVSICPANANATTVDLAGGGAGYVQGAVYSVDKGSFQNMSAAQTAALTQADIISCYDYKYMPCNKKLKFYIKLSKFWS